MKNIHKVLILVPIIILAACNLERSDAVISPASTDVPVDVSTSTPAPTNIALGQNTTASAHTIGELPEYAVDGNPETSWNAGASFPQWIQIDLGRYTTINNIKLIVAQYPNGETTHQIFVGASSSDLRLIQQFSGSTADNQVLEFTPTIPLSNIQFIKIITTESPSWTAWKEIEVLGVEGGQIPTANPIKQEADIIYNNGTLLTIEKDQPTAQAIAIKGDKILAVGNESDVMKFKGTGTKVVDLKGLTLTPGFINSHSHRIGDRAMLSEQEVSFEKLFYGILKEGWTSTHEMFVWDARMDELISLDRQNQLPIRVSAYLAVGFDYDYNPWYRNAGYKPLQQFSPNLQIGGIKITLDREWGEQIFFTQEQLNQMVLDATQDGWQVAIHSFSPRGNEELLNAYEKALNGQSNDVLRLRHEHIGILSDEQLRREADLGVIASVQLIGTPVYADDVSFKKYIPQENWPDMSPWRDMINAGIFMIGNVDDPWCCTAWRKETKDSFGDPTVMQAIYQGATRYYFTGRQPEPWQVSQAVNVQEALKMLTINGAYAAHQEDVIGSLKPGKYADLVILSANPLETPVEKIPDIQVVMTMIGGDVKYCKSNQQGVCEPRP
jgi:predicted amidohydrolase YtcJ